MSPNAAVDKLNLANIPEGTVVNNIILKQIKRVKLSVILVSIKNILNSKENELEGNWRKLGGKKI